MEATTVAAVRVRAPVGEVGAEPAVEPLEAADLAAALVDRVERVGEVAVAALPEAAAAR